jgi:integrase
MILTVFRPKRIKNGKACVARSYRGRYRLEGEDNITDIPLYTTDKRVARERLDKIVREKQLESVGILPPQVIRTASQTPFEKHLADFVADLQAIGRDEQYIFDLKHRVTRLIKECRWEHIKDISSDSYLAWRARQHLAPKTLNEYLASVRSLLNWMEKHGRIDRNPLLHIQKVQTNGKQTRPRRAFTHEEIKLLLAVAGPRKVVYLTAVYTGLRRKELKLMDCDDLHLDVDQPFVNVRPSTTKNHKQAVIALHADVVERVAQTAALDGQGIRKRPAENGNLQARSSPCWN